MESIFTNHKEKVLKNSERIDFEVKNKGVYLISISAKTKDEKQLSGTDDEDLRIEIDSRKFPLLSNQQRYFDSPAAFSGGATHGLTKVVFFILWLDTGFHNLYLIPDIAATVVSTEVRQLDKNSTLNEFSLPLNLTAEDGDRRDWITFVLVDANLGSFTPELVLKRRFFDSDDIKITIDDSVKQAHYNKRQKLWYFVASLFRGEQQSEEFKVNLSMGTHYIEFAADRTPTLKSMHFSNLTFRVPTTIQEKIEYRANQHGLDPKIMIRLAKRESQFNPKATSLVGAKGLYQLTEITIRQIKELGFKITDPYNIDQNIQGAFIYFEWLYKRYEGEKNQIEKTLAAWNYGLAHIPQNEPLDFDKLPKETKNLINDVLGDHDF
ncbi:MAG: hypothetical protein COU69_01170 [Candidatus Pacebacteria bacterium CG10_big_fil_rev_8_21_14_0_10_56_10]|nr:MAG: hypothetical protein COU69_01170 [Candidatus Pacebacteria bacterium CG10_big_fil_rev_8_21_14_0_10_56_10]